ncbi:zinc finger protein 862-like [Xenia sp. Carnegie-2017]|uniref:zinc finger protein 862-like n=1 Tax=Xenia sp. Carnegie-2017 TaxID=2897299 RepID=UPI001F04E9EA|nr:zinc finger protein 862-like [Xenia sp. Carnegie-2017]
MSVETVENEDASGLKEAMNEAFARFGITNFESKLAATGLDGASFNMGRNTGLEARLKEVAPWLTVVHCFNHRLEFAAADAFNATFFAQVDGIMRQLFSLYQKSPKKLRELKKLAEVYGETVYKPIKASGTRWIDHKVRATKVFLENYGMYMQHLEQAATTSPDAQKQKINGFLAKWKDARFPMYASIFVDIIGPLRVLSLGLQTDDNDPVKALRRIKEFDWTMVKLQGSTFGKATFDKFRKDCKPTGDDKNQISYQGVVLTNYPRALNGAAGQRQEWIDAIILCLGNRFSDLQETPVYKHLCPIIDTQSWPGEEVNLVSYGDESVTLLVDHFIQL